VKSAKELPAKGYPVGTAFEMDAAGNVSAGGKVIGKVDVAAPAAAAPRAANAPTLRAPAAPMDEDMDAATAAPKTAARTVKARGPIVRKRAAKGGKSS
jgi:hypothetical protein